MLNKNITFAVIFGLMLLFSIDVDAQWNIPAGEKDKKAPTEATVDMALKGKTLYMKNCKACHQVPKTTNLKPPAPTDLGSEEYLTSRTEGETFFQTFKGNGGSMGGFEGRLSEDEVWDIVHYLGTFRAGSTIDLASVQQDLDLKVNLKEDGHKIVAVATNAGVPAGDVKVLFSVKRYFGNLTLGVAKTNANGYAAVSFPNDLPGDKSGNAEIIVKFANQDRFGKKEVTKTVNWATVLHVENMTEQRAMWGTDTPLWLLFIYFGITIGVWLGIIYVVFQILKIRKVAN